MPEDFPGLAERIKTAMEARGLEPERVAAEIGRSKACVYDLMAHDGELRDCYTVGESLRMAKFLGVKLGELLAPGRQVKDRLSFTDLTALVRSRISSLGISLDEYEEKVGWGLLGIPDNPERVLLLSLAGLSDLCADLGIDLVRVVP